MRGSESKARIEAAAALWEEEQRDPSWLLAEGRPLAEGEEILATRQQELSPDLIEFIEASAAHAWRGRQRKRAIAGGVMAALALLGGLSLWFGYDARVKEREAIAQRERAEQQHQVALARQLAAQASILADRGGSEASTERAAALAVESWRRMHNPEAADAADRIIRVLPSARIDRPPYSNEQHVAFSPDSRSLATTSYGLVRLIETASGKEVARIEHTDAAWDVDFSPDGRWLATGWYDQQARLIDTASGKELARIENGKNVEDVAYSAERSFLAAWVSMHMQFVRGVAFSPDGRWLVTEARDGTVRLTETASGREVGDLQWL